MANKIRLNIGGMDIYVSTDDEEIYMQGLGNELNQHMQDMMHKNSFLSTTMAAVITALEYCDNAKKSKAQVETLNAQIARLTEEVAGARMESDEARREIERLNKENQTLRGRLSRQ
ncbi:MAG: cell division protein ZapA [Clostridia bacterium]|nr:cell division protein ZapA [Clostridia bacterium]